MDCEATSCTWPGCDRAACAFIFGIKQGTIDRKEELCESHGSEFAGRYRSELAAPGARERRGPHIRCVVEMISGSESRHLNVVRLRERGGKRHLTLESGGFEISAMMWSAQRRQAVARSSHELMIALVSGAGACVKCSEITGFVQRDGLNVYEAQVVLGFPGADAAEAFVPARASDAVHVAFLADAPIFVNETVLSPDDERA